MASEEEQDSDEIVAALIVKYGMKNIMGLVEAISMCEQFDCSFPPVLSLVSKLVNVDERLLRNMHLEVSRGSELLRQLATPEKDRRLLLLPPVTACTLGCQYVRQDLLDQPRLLELCNDPVGAVLYDVTGKPIPVLRHSMRCRSCASTFLYDMYLDKRDGKYRFYKEERKYVQITEKTFWTRDLCSLLVEQILHARSSFQAFNTAFTETFLLDSGVNPALVSKAFFRFEIEAEMREQNLLEFGFAKPSQLGSVLPVIDQLRCQRLYPHTCNPVCHDRGCDVLSAGDGVWTHHFKHCAFVQENVVNNVKLVNYPNICPEQPTRQHGALYCVKHAKVAELSRLPTVRKDVTPASLKAAQLHLQGMDDMLSKVGASSIELPADTAVKSGGIVKSGLPGGAVDPTAADPCSKNLCDYKVYPTRSRGYYFVVRTGGHVDLFVPMFKSESTGQVFLVTIAYLFNKLPTIPESEWPKFFLAYDNMCNLDKLRATRHPLPLPAPYDMMWSKIGKAIDRFHLGNHKNHKCHTEYNPEKITAAHPDRKTTNTQACEQTFSWLRGFKSAMFKMPKHRQLFFLHRVVTRRNRYLQQKHAGCLLICSPCQKK